MKVEVYSDVVCPWCYIGERRLATALARMDGDAVVEVVFRPYQLDPSAPAEGEPLKRYLERRYGAVAATMTNRAGAIAEEEGIAVDWDAAIAANTFDAHRLMQHALAEGGPAVQRSLADRLFEAHFVLGLDVGRHETLVALAGEAGLDATRAAELLASDEGVMELRESLDQARRMGIRAVPSMVIDGRYLVEGAQPADTLMEIMHRVRGEAA